MVAIANEKWEKKRVEELKSKLKNSLFFFIIRKAKYSLQSYLLLTSIKMNKTLESLTIHYSFNTRLKGTTTTTLKHALYKLLRFSRFYESEFEFNPNSILFE